MDNQVHSATVLCSAETKTNPVKLKMGGGGGGGEQALVEYTKKRHLLDAIMAYCRHYKSEVV